VLPLRALAAAHFEVNYSQAIGVTQHQKCLYLKSVPLNCGKFSMNRVAIIKEFFEFLRQRKRWWIAPILVFMVLLGVLLIFASTSTLAPFIYSLF
jgi:hypothetical protein